MKRIIGWDVLRFFSFIAIIYFHYLYIVWYQLTPPAAEYSYFLQIFNIFSRALSFSGFTVLFLTAALWGLKNNLPSKRFYLFLILASVFLSYLTSDTHFEWSWDIYFLLIVGFSVLQIIKKHWLLGLIGFALLWIPFWKFRPMANLPTWAVEIFFGRCEIDQGDWPLLPWVGLIWLGYASGKFLFFRLERLQTVTQLEFFIWLPLLMVSTLGLGSYFNIRIGPGFSCDVFTQPLYVFWAHLLWFVFFMRLSLLAVIQNFLARTVIFSWISNLMLSRKFGAAYFIHFLIIFILSLRAEFIHANAWAGILGFLLIIPVTELLLRLIFKHFPTRKA